MTDKNDDKKEIPMPNDNEKKAVDSEKPSLEKPLLEQSTAEQSISEQAKSKQPMPEQVLPKESLTTDTAQKKTAPVETKKITKKAGANKSFSTSNKQKKNQPTIGQRLRKTFLLWLIVVALLILAIAYGGWQLWQWQEQRLQQSQRVTEEQHQLLAKALSDESQALKKQLSDQKGQFALLVQQTTKEQKILQQRLDAQLEKINGITGDSRDAWMLKEARHLLRLATQRQLTGSKPESVIGLLEAADNTLRDIDISALFVVREQIKNDIVALQLMPKVDREGIYLQLSAIIDQVNQLPPVPSITSEAASSEAVSESTPIDQSEEVSESTSEQSIGLWQAITQRITYTLDSMDDYIRITHHDDNIAPSLSNVQRVMAQETMRLLLIQAQTALLREEEKIYQQSILQVVTFLRTHYAHYDEKELLMALLDNLYQQKITLDLPSVSASLSILDQYINAYQTEHSEEQKIESNTELQEAL